MQYEAFIERVQERGIPGARARRGRDARHSRNPGGATATSRPRAPVNRSARSSRRSGMPSAKASTPPCSLSCRRDVDTSSTEKAGIRGRLVEGVTRESERIDGQRGA